MSYKEDIKSVLDHKEVFPVPYSVKFTKEALNNLNDHFHREFDPIKDTGSYVTVSHTNNGWNEVKPGYFMDYFGVVWNKTIDTTLGTVDIPPLKNASFGNYNFPDPKKIPVYSFIIENNKKHPDLFHMLSIGFTLFERAWSLVGMENLLIYFLTEPDFVHELLDRITEYNIGVIKMAVATGGIDCVHFGDDWGSQHGLLISKEMWQEFIQPRFEKTCRYAKKLGLLVSLHSCGKVDVLIPEMIHCGVDVLDPFQPEIMDVFKIKKQYEGKMAFWGGLSVQNTLPQGTVEEVKRESRKLLDKLGPGGGYIFAPSHSITRDVPVENIMAFLEMARNQ